MFLLAGLGNPGSQYAKTRHNVGFDVIDCLAARWGATLSDKRFNALSGATSVAGEKAILVRPQTFMNLSGDAVGPMAGFFRIPPSRVLVAHDELDLPFGDLRLKWSGGHGGHNGLRDLHQKLGTPEYARLRVGIGRPEGPMDPAAWVLSRWTEPQARQLPSILDRAADMIEAVLREGIQAAMNRWNAPPEQRPMVPTEGRPRRADGKA